MVRGGLLSLNPAGSFTTSGVITADRFVATSTSANSFTTSVGNGVYALKHATAAWGIWYNSGGASMLFDVGGVTPLTLTSTSATIGVPFNSSVASGNNAFLVSNAGARIKLSSGGTTDYLYSDGATLITSAGDFTAVGKLRGANGYFLVNDVTGFSSVAVGTTSGAAANIGGVVSANSTGVGNVGASGPDDLQTYQLPANSLTGASRGIRIKAWGTTANNANAKSVRLSFGSADLITKQLTASIAGFWELEATILRTGVSAQDFFAKAVNYGGTTVSSTDGETVAMLANVGTATQTETAAIDIKVKSTVSTADNDIVSQGLIVEYI